MPATPQYVSTLSELAQALDISEAHLRCCRRRGLKAYKTRRGYNVSRHLRELERFRVARTPPTDSGRIALGQELLREQIKERREKAELARLEVQERRGQLVPIERVRAREKRRVQMVKRELLALPEPLSLDLDFSGKHRAEIKRVLAERITRLLQRFSRYARHGDEADGIEATAE